MADIANIMRSVGIAEDQIEAVAKLAPWLMPRDWDAVKAAIRADPCRNWRVVARRYQVSRRTVYRVWSQAS